MIACPRCSECEGQPHHWIPAEDLENGGSPDYECKHCDHGFAWMCIDCDNAVSSPDVQCGDCNDDWKTEHEPC